MRLIKEGRRYKLHTRSLPSLALTGVVIEDIAHAGSGAGDVGGIGVMRSRTAVYSPGIVIDYV